MATSGWQLEFGWDEIGWQREPKGSERRGAFCFLELVWNRRRCIAVVAMVDLQNDKASAGKGHK